MDQPGKVASPARGQLNYAILLLIQYCNNNNDYTNIYEQVVRLMLQILLQLLTRKSFMDSVITKEHTSCRTCNLGGDGKKLRRGNHEMAGMDMDITYKAGTLDVGVASVKTSKPSLIYSRAGMQLAT